MERILICNYCESIAKYFCTCGDPKANFCVEHRDLHEESSRDHNIKLHKYNRIDLERKEILISQILKVKLETQNTRSKVIKKTDQFIAESEFQCKTIIHKLTDFISICDLVLQDLFQIENISEKQIYPPLEAFLLARTSDSLLQNITPPKVIFPNSCNLISYKASTFPHFIYNYSDISVVFPEKNKLKVYPAGRTIGANKFDWFGKYLNIGNNKIIITGGGDGNEGSSSCFILDVESKQICQVANLKKKRFRHSMAWIERSPAVIGGVHIGEVMNSVEVFRNNEWKEISPLNISRSSCSAITTQQATWAIGGLSEIRLDSIEKYENKWTLLDLKLIQPCSLLGLFNLANTLLLIGGKITPTELTSKVYCLNIFNFKLTEEKSLNFPFVLSDNPRIRNSETISAFGYKFDSSVCEIIIEGI